MSLASLTPPSSVSSLVSWASSGHSETVEAADDARMESRLDGSVPLSATAALGLGTVVAVVISAAASSLASPPSSTMGWNVGVRSAGCCSVGGTTRPGGRSITNGYRVDVGVDVGVDVDGDGEGDGDGDAVEVDEGEIEGDRSGIDTDDATAADKRDEAVVAKDRVESVDRERARYAELLVTLLLPLRLVTMMGGLACTVSSYRRATRCEDREGDAGEVGCGDVTDVEEGEDKEEADILGVNLGLLAPRLPEVLPPPTLLNRCSAIV